MARLSMNSPAPPSGRCGRNNVHGAFFLHCIPAGWQAMPGVEQAGAPVSALVQIVQPFVHSRHEGLSCA